MFLGTKKCNPGITGFQAGFDCAGVQDSALQPMLCVGSARFSSCAGPARCSAHWSHLLLLCRTSIGHLYHDYHGGVACPYQSVSEDKLIESCYFINGHSSCMETHDMFGLCMTLMQNKSPKVHATSMAAPWYTQDQRVITWGDAAFGGVAAAKSLHVKWRLSAYDVVTPVIYVQQNTVSNMYDVQSCI